MTNENKEDVKQPKSITGCHALYRIKRIERICKDGKREFQYSNFETEDVEALRKKLRGRKYRAVYFVYETR